ncbi:GyrI-like domain-containing protein [Streptomyces radicis]|uniref:AraC family transcriptional regulator n=1 Tax=Streptomyces radicis TaxID=1750517 RepID=A0A3A9WJY6_9ACTN|nr:GyrI-like domain-containing protein [Streptomyces radicis]RKN09764.1 AraC family transcriptional regulator [Streptomyces radicis]RKN23401.1 AraC family transcriptional regulator [Streptomyces radicis]
MATITERPERPYVAIRARVTMDTIPSIADRVPEVIGWLAGRGVAPEGAPFLRYRVIDMERFLDIEAGVPVARVLDPDPEAEIVSGTLPAGRYATVTHTGPFDELVGATKTLLGWADAKGLRWDVRDGPEGQVWGCRLEEYETNPAAEPDPAKWVTRLAFRLAAA